MAARAEEDVLEQDKVRNGALYERTSILVGNSGIVKLHAARVFLAGVGGVGGHCAEALVRAGIGSITLVDHDVVSATNKNRQLVALDSTVGKSKVEELAKRLVDINALCQVSTLDAFISPEDVDDLLSRQPYTHVVDCIDSVECKVALLERSVKLGIPTFSSCGAGGRLDPTLIKEGDLFDTENDALARHCRSELRRRGIGFGSVHCVSSTEKGLPPLAPSRVESGGRDRAMNGTISYMPPMFGLHLSSMVVRHALDPEAAERKVKTAIKKREREEKKADQAKAAAVAAKAKTEVSTKRETNRANGKDHSPPRKCARADGQ